MALKRINITGNAGSGKTTLAKNLGRRLSIPVIHLDQIVWQPNWQKTPPEINSDSVEYSQTWFLLNAFKQRPGFRQRQRQDS